MIVCLFGEYVGGVGDKVVDGGFGLHLPTAHYSRLLQPKQREENREGEASANKTSQPKLNERCSPFCH